MFRDRLLFIAGYIALAVHVQVLFCVNCVTNNQNLQQLALHKNYCGDIHNISFPFRLKAHPLDNCENKYFELECENNRTVLHLLSGKYYVQAINYTSQFISLVDVGIQRNNCSSLPLHSLTYYNFTDTVDPYYARWNEIAVLVSCEKQVKSPLYIDATSNISNAFCENRGGGVSSSSLKKHSYFLIGSYGSLSWSDVLNLCSVDAAFPTRELRNPDRSFRQRNITSLLEVHNILADGFDLYWELYTNGQCKRQQLCFSNYPKNATAGACPGSSFQQYLGSGGSLPQRT